MPLRLTGKANSKNAFNIPHNYSWIKENIHLMFNVRINNLTLVGPGCFDYEFQGGLAGKGKIHYSIHYFILSYMKYTRTLYDTIWNKENKVASRTFKKKN